MYSDSLLFKCIRCDHVDIVGIAYPHGMNDSHYECTKCQTGVWHDYFSYVKYDPKKHNVINGELKETISLE